MQTWLPSFGMSSSLLDESVTSSRFSSLISSRNSHPVFARQDMRTISQLQSSPEDRNSPALPMMIHCERINRRRPDLTRSTILWSPRQEDLYRRVTSRHLDSTMNMKSTGHLEVYR